MNRIEQGKYILELIERRDETLEADINAMVWCFLRGVGYISHYTHWAGLLHVTCSDTKLPPFEFTVPHNYYTSLDAAASVVPDGWEVLITEETKDRPSKDDKYVGFRCELHKGALRFRSPYLPKEAPARLYAAIAAHVWLLENEGYHKK